MSYDSAVNIVKSLVTQPEFNSSDQSLRIFKDLHLAAKAKLYLYLSPLTRGAEVDINADSDSGLLKIKGISSIMDSDKFEIMINQVLNKLSEVKRIEFE
jgi:hypothetical protein